MPARAADTRSVPQSAEESKTLRRLSARSRVIYDVSLDMGARLLYVQLDDMAGGRGVLWPKLPTVAARLGVSERQARYWIGDLKAAGYVVTERQRRGLLFTLTWFSDRQPIADQAPIVIGTETGEPRQCIADHEPDILNELVFKELGGGACGLCGGTGVRTYTSAGGRRVSARTWEAPCGCEKP